MGVAFIARHFTRRRMQRRMELLERQHALERERARIAQDIHDDVGASLSRIAMLSQPAPGDLAEPQRASAMLSRIYKTAREVTRSLDEIVWAVDPRHDTLDSLVDYMGKYAQHFFGATNLRCRLDLPVQVPAWPLSTEIRHNLFLAFKESLNNAAKHASADEVRISFGLRADSFVLTVKDNGRGFEVGRSDSSESDRVISGSGLANMKGRLARIGGRCEISSRRGEGTSISFIVDVIDQHARTSSSPSESRPPSPPVR
jgi:signal transduction histidine kinase